MNLHKCPTCNGQGIVSKPPWVAGDQDVWYSTTAMTWPCKTCDAKGYIGVDMDLAEWLDYGMGEGWCGPAVCYIHDGVPTSHEEDETFDDGADPCIHIIRLYDDFEHGQDVEANHSPSVWRK